MTVERFNLRQIKMETGQQVRMHVRNLLEKQKTKERVTKYFIPTVPVLKIPTAKVCIHQLDSTHIDKRYMA